MYSCRLERWKPNEALEIRERVQHTDILRSWTHLTCTVVGLHFPGWNPARMKLKENQGIRGGQGRRRMHPVEWWTTMRRCGGPLVVGATRRELGQSASAYAEGARISRLCISQISNLVTLAQEVAQSCWTARKLTPNAPNYTRWLGLNPPSCRFRGPSGGSDGSRCR
jgi:hypothetical protein